jgi:TonB family protein
MVAGSIAPEWQGPSRRRVPRFRIETPLDVTVLRSGIPDTVPGRSVNVCERGIAAMLAGQLKAGETVGVELRLSPTAAPLRTRALVRYQDRLRYGLEFVAMTAEQRTAIRDWTNEAKAETDAAASPATALAAMAAKDGEGQKKPGSHGGDGVSGKSKKRWRGARWLIACLLIAIAAALFWWKWNRAWEELESGLKSPATAAAEKPPVQVPAEVMQKLLVHRVEPVYPAEARKENLQGLIALDIVVGRDGSVQNMRPLNGPDVLARAAMDALRWWKFEPYRVNGEPAVVETTVAVEFKR